MRATSVCFTRRSPNDSATLSRPRRRTTTTERRCGPTTWAGPRSQTQANSRGCSTACTPHQGHLTEKKTCTSRRSSRRPGLLTAAPTSPRDETAVATTDERRNLSAVCGEEARRSPRRGRRLPRLERGDPSGRAALVHARLGGRRHPRGLARTRGGHHATARPTRDLGDPAARRHDHRHDAHEPVQA